VPEAYVYDAVRTPRGRGKVGGALYEISPVQLAAQVLRAVRDRQRLDTRLVDDVILGCVQPVFDQGADIARSAALLAAFADNVAGLQINRFCGSGLEAVNLAAAKIRCEEAELVIAGGVESMSRIPMGTSGGAMRTDPEVAFAGHYVPQGVSADLIATRDGYSRSDVDAYALESQRRAALAWNEGRFARSIVPVSDENGTIVLDRDEHMRPDVTLESLAKLPASFESIGRNAGFDSVAIQRYPDTERIDHVHTAGNSSGIVDGAAAVLIGSRAIGERLGLKPRARIRATASVGSEPTIMLTGPLSSTLKVLAKAGMTTRDIDLFEVNEAFAVVPLWFMRELAIDSQKVNVNGGAIAMGHPLGATGAMLLGTLLDELERRGLGVGLVTLCVAGGMGTAAILERVS
jgi:acetyl-CoA C-acetyltransferase